MPSNITSIKTSSNGAWQGDNPLYYAFPLLMVQCTLILIVTRFLALLFKPLRQPKVVAEIVGGILLGPSALGRNKTYMHTIFPIWSTPILESVADIGLLFYLFLVGLELDMNSLRRSSLRTFTIAAAGISLPFVSGMGVAFVLRKTISGVENVGFVQFLVFIGVALSITAFPVLARILAELKLLTTHIGETAMAAAAFNDVAAWILLAVAVALSGDDGGLHHRRWGPLVSVWVLLSGIAFVIFMMVFIRPVMKRVAGRCSPDTGAADDVYICLALAGVMLSGLVTEVVGIHSIFGAFVFGLTIPKGAFAQKLIERMEDFVSGLLIPLFFASSGLKTDVAKIRGVEAWGLLVMVISTACVGKILGTFAAAMLCRIPLRESLTLGVLMNTKGLVELIVLNIGKEKKVLNDEMFAILVLMALCTTFMTTPLVMAIYKPARVTSTHTRRKLEHLNSNDHELRVLACIQGHTNVPSIINLIESIRSTKNSSLKLFIMHLVELTERSSSIILVKSIRKNGFPFFNRFHHGHWQDQFVGAFKDNSQLGRVLVRPTTAISSLSTMHDDICHVVEDKRVTLIILPFPKQRKREEAEEEENNEVPQNLIVECVGYGWREVNQRVLKNAPCSVGLLVDKGYGNGPQDLGSISSMTQQVCVMFFGGPDDREALELGKKMSQHPRVRVTVVRFIDRDGLEESDILLPSTNNNHNTSNKLSIAKRTHKKEKELDEKAIAELRSKNGMVEYIEKMTSNIAEEVVEIGQSGDYGLIVVGKGRFPSTMVAELAERQTEQGELGPIGDILASSEHGVVSSVLVIQQHDEARDEEAPVSRVV